MADAGEVMAGPIGREIFGAAQILFLVFIMGSHILTFSIMMNTVTSHGTCTIVFGVVGLIVCLVFTMPRTLHRVSYMAIVSFMSIVAAVMITMVGVGVERPGNGKVDVTVQTNFSSAFLAVTNIIFAFAGKSLNLCSLLWVKFGLCAGEPPPSNPGSTAGSPLPDLPDLLSSWCWCASTKNFKRQTFAHVTAGHVAFFSFMSELKAPETYPKALFLLQGVDVSMYLIVAIVTYRYAGAEVTSPAVGSTSPLLQKISYGIAIPTIVIAGVINGHDAAKYIYVRLFRDTDMMGKRNWKSFRLWATIVLILWVIAWIIAKVIPVFNDLLSLISALFASWFTYGLSGVFWLFMNRGRYRESARKMFLTGLNITTFCIGAAIVSLPSLGVSPSPAIMLTAETVRYWVICLREGDS